LKTRLAQFDPAHWPGKFSEDATLEIRLSQATLATAEQRFADALKIITVEDEKAKRASTGAEIDRFVRVLQIRGDSFYGLHEWQNALDRYREMLTLQSNRIAVITRVADCQYALGRSHEALTTYDALSKRHNNRGDDFLIQGKPGSAIAHYEKAIEIQTWLIEQARRSELVNELARSYNNRGNAYLVHTKLDAAITDFEKAVEIQTRLLEQGGGNELAIELARSHNNRANAFLVQGKVDAAIRDYEKAIAMRGQLIERGRTELANELGKSHNNLGNSFLVQQKLDAALAHYDKAIEIQVRLTELEGRTELARSYNNRGVVRHAQGKTDAALADFEGAIKNLNELSGEQGRRELVTIHFNRDIVGRARVNLDATMGYSEKVVDALIRPQVTEQSRQREYAVVLAASLKNCGYARLVQGKPENAIEDFKKSVEIYARLVQQEGHKDLALEFARSLRPLAWIYATYPDKSFRDGGKAKECALKACELSEWKAFVPVECLAAAFAETGHFPDAIKLQENALALAPSKYKSELRLRLELYKSGNPYRAPLPKSE
jgi:tetratricopeptide (TPR) repeat protein